MEHVIQIVQLGKRLLFVDREVQRSVTSDGLGRNCVL